MLSRHGFRPQHFAPSSRHEEKEESRESSSRGATVTVDLSEVLTGLAVVFDVGRRHYQEHKRSRRELHEAVMDLARRYHGVLSPTDLVSHLAVSVREAVKTLETLREGGACTLLGEVQEQPLYLFVRFLPSYLHCEYCCASVEHRSNTCSCPNCGARLQVKRRI